MEIMNNWNQFLTAQGARPVPAADAPDSNVPAPIAPVADFGQSLTVSQLQDGFVACKIKVSISCKQLYHDREEVTCHLRRLGK